MHRTTTSFIRLTLYSLGQYQYKVNFIIPFNNFQRKQKCWIQGQIRASPSHKKALAIHTTSCVIKGNTQLGSAACISVFSVKGIMKTTLEVSCTAWCSQHNLIFGMPYIQSTIPLIHKAVNTALLVIVLSEESVDQIDQDAQHLSQSIHCSHSTLSWTSVAKLQSIKSHCFLVLTPVFSSQANRPTTLSTHTWNKIK